MRENFYADKYKDKKTTLRTHFVMNKGIMEFSIKKLKKELKEIGEVVTLESALDWLRSSKMFTEEEIKDFIENMTWMLLMINEVFFLLLLNEQPFFYALLHILPLQLGVFLGCLLGCRILLEVL